MDLISVIVFLKRNRLKFLFFLVFFLFLSIIGLFWLVLGILVLAGSYSLIMMIKKYVFSFIIISFLGVMILSVLVRLFMFEIYRVPSESMEDALFPGDYILVSKLNYGPKIPASPFQIPWVNLLIDAPDKNDSSVWSYKRLSGFSKVQHSDIVVFRSPLDDKSFLVKRCIGLPGESIQIINSRVAINKQYFKTIPTAKHSYTVWLNDINMFASFADSLNVVYNLRYKEQNASVTLNSREREILENLNGIDSIKPRFIRGPAYPNEPKIGWSPDNLGPIIIPVKGMKIALNRKNYLLYKQAIINNEHVSLYEKNGQYYINNKKVLSYIFKQDYYFMMGDNRPNSNDSRFWGFLSEQNIEGKTLFVLFPDSV